MNLVEVDGLHNVAREKYLDHPVHEDAHFTFQAGQFGQVNGTPHEPGKKPGESDRVLSRQWDCKFGSCGVVTYNPQLSPGIEMEGLEGSPFDTGMNVVR